MDSSAVVLAQAVINTQGIVTWIVQNIVPIIFCIVGVLIMASSKKGRYSEGITTTGILFLGLIVIALGLLAFPFAEGIVNILFTETGGTTAGGAQE